MNANGWHYAQGEKTFGPVDLKELQVILSRISDPRNLLVWRVGFEGWQRAGNVPELAQLIDKPPPLPDWPVSMLAATAIHIASSGTKNIAASIS